MDPKAQMPDIKSEVNKIDDGKKKKSSGVLGSLFGGGGGGAGGLGGLGAGASGAGGLLATKAGMLALVLMGSAVAGGIGLAGYKMFGPGDADKAGGNLSLFAPKPAPVEDQNAAGGAAGGGGDGSSASLSMMAQSAAKDKEADASADPTDKTAADAAAAKAAADEAAKKAAADEAAKKTAATGPINSGGGAGAVGSFGKGGALGKKFGALSGTMGGGGGGGSSSAGMSGKLGDNMAMANRNGSTSGFSKGGAGSRSSSVKGIAGARGRSARGDARRVMGDQANGKAGSSFAAGKTYDGSATNAGSAIGPDGGAIGMDGAGDGAGSAQPKSINPNSLKNTNEQEPPEPPAKHMVTPWEDAIARIQMLSIAALVLAMIASKFQAYPWVKWVIGAIIAAMAVYAGAIAIKMMQGPNAQVLQGQLCMATAVGIGIMATMVMTAGKDSGGAFGGKEMSMTNMSGLFMLGGGMIAVGLIGGMMAPKPQQVDANDPKYKKGDSDIDGFF